MTPPCAQGSISVFKGRCWLALRACSAQIGALAAFHYLIFKELFGQLSFLTLRSFMAP